MLLDRTVTSVFVLAVVALLFLGSLVLTNSRSYSAAVADEMSALGGAYRLHTLCDLAVDSETAARGFALSGSAWRLREV